MAEVVPQVSVLIVGFNSSRYLPACLACLKDAARQHTYEVCFIDNGSDGSGQLVTRLAPGATIVPGRGNIGFGAANNVLARHASGELLLLLNPDTRLYPGAIDLLLEAAQAAPQFGILGGTTILDDLGEVVLPALELPDHRTILRSLMPFASYPTRRPVDAGIAQVNAVSGGFMLVRQEVYQELGGFDERFFLYGEDLDLCRRATLAGWKIGNVDAAKVFHDVGSGNFGSARRLLLRNRGTATYHHVHYPGWRGWTHVALMWLALVPRLVIAAVPAIGRSDRRNRFSATASLVLKPWRWMSGYPPMQPEP